MARMTCKRGKIPGWNKSMEGAWRNKKNPRLTVEIVSAKSQGLDWGETWGYGFTALDDRAREGSPHIFSTKKEAKSWARGWMCKNPKG